MSLTAIRFLLLVLLILDYLIVTKVYNSDISAKYNATFLSEISLKLVCILLLLPLLVIIFVNGLAVYIRLLLINYAHIAAIF
ncbi:MAG: hypothetical protein ACI4VC_00600 [Clostridia bacterium]